MIQIRMKFVLVLTATQALVAFISAQNAPQKGIPLEQYRWTIFDYDWPSDQMKDEFIQTRQFIAENNALAGVKWYRNEVYLTIPRWRNGIPSSLNKVVTKNGKHVLQPYPSWEMNKLGDCSKLQYVQSMEIDPNTGIMWIIDVGRTNIYPVEGTPNNTCPPKIVRYNMITEQEVDRYVFPNNVASYTSNFLNDIVIDPDRGFAYITDTSLKGGIIVWNSNNMSSHRFEHRTMEYEPEGVTITINSFERNFTTPSDGIALSRDKSMLFYCPLAGFYLHSFPTDIARDPAANIGDHVRTVGRKPSQTDGMAFAKDNLYYGLLGENSVYRWNISKDISDQQVPIGSVNMTSQFEVTRDDQSMQWVDTFGFDDFGYLWYTTNKLQLFFTQKMDFSGGDGANFRVFKTFINEKSYLSRDDIISPTPSATPTSNDNMNNARSLQCSVVFLLSVLVMVYIK